MPKPFPKEFREDVVRVARSSDAPVAQVAKDFGISESCLHRWLALDDIEQGNRPGVTTSESADFARAWVDAGPVVPGEIVRC